MLVFALFFSLFLKLEIQHLEEGFFFKYMVSQLQNKDIHSDFLNGENGAVQLSSEQLSQLEELYKLLGPVLPNKQTGLSNQFHALAKNLIFLVKGKNKEIAGTTYKELRNLLSSIKESGYFSRPSEQLEDGISSDDMEEKNLADKLKSVGISAEQPEDVQSLSNDQQDTDDNVMELAAPVENGPLQDLRKYGQIQGMQQRNGGGGNFVVEEYSVSDKMVGLIIERGGEQIIRLQTETGCKIQLASDSNGNPKRLCTLSFSRKSVETLQQTHLVWPLLVS